MVFQSYAVWPHMNVYDNICVSLKIKKTDKKEIEERVNQALKTVHLDSIRTDSLQNCQEDSSRG